MPIGVFQIVNDKYKIVRFVDEDGNNCNFYDENKITWHVDDEVPPPDFICRGSGIAGGMFVKVGFDTTGTRTINWHV